MTRSGVLSNRLTSDALCRSALGYLSMAKASAARMNERGYLLRDRMSEFAMSKAGSIGAAGELIVQARLLVRGWTAGNVNIGGMMNAPAVDILAMKGNCRRAIAVKTTGHAGANVQWNAPPGWKTLFKGDTRPDFVIFVWFTDKINPDSCRIFVVPAQIVDRDVLKSHNHWHSYLKRDGSPRKNAGHVAIGWLGKDTEANIPKAKVRGSNPLGRASISGGPFRTHGLRFIPET